MAFARQFGIVVTHADQLNEKERVKIIQKVDSILVIAIPVNIIKLNLYGIVG